MGNEIKATRKSVLTKAMDMDFTAEEKEIIGKMIASLDKKGSNGISDKVQAERTAEFQAIYDYLAENGASTATQIAKALDMSVQKITARIKGADGIYRKPAKGKNPALINIAPFEVADEGDDE
jgi:hypothetical protein